MNYCNKLNLDLSPVSSTFDLYSIKKEHTVLDKSEINPEIQSFLSERNISISWAEIFYRKPFDIVNIHTDDLGGDIVKINWIYGGENSTMFWFAPKDPSIVKIPFKTAINSNYLYYKRDEVNLVHKEQLRGAYLVQVGVPHAVINSKAERYCISLVLQNQHNQFLSMRDAISIFSDLIV
jgi:hypothetical protein